MRSSEPHLLQAEHPQLSQPLLTGGVLLSLHHLNGPLLDSLQYVLVCLALGSPELESYQSVSPVMSSGGNLTFLALMKIVKWLFCINFFCYKC